jgi:hypothetical protein
MSCGDYSGTQVFTTNEASTDMAVPVHFTCQFATDCLALKVAYHPLLAFLSVRRFKLGRIDALKAYRYPILSIENNRIRVANIDVRRYNPP